MRQSRNRVERRALKGRQVEGGVSRPILTPETENVNEPAGLRPDGNGAVGEGVNNQFGGINPSIRTLTAIPPSQARPTAAAPNVVEPPTTLQTVVTSAVLTRSVPNIAQNTPTAVFEAPSVETSLADIIIPDATAGVGEEVLPTGAQYNVEEEVAGAEGAGEGLGEGLPELGEKESEVILPENNRGVAVGIAFGSFALLAICVAAGFLIMRWKKGKRESIFDRPPPPGIDRATTIEPKSNTYVNEKMPSQTQYASYANLEGAGEGGVRKSLGRWMQNTQSRFSSPTTDGGIVSMYARQNDSLPPPPPSFLRPGAGGDGR